MKQCSHKFKPRYTERWSTVIEELFGAGHKVETASDASLRPYLKEKTYIYDICTKCGMIIGKVRE